jgi:type II secretory pathway pseudopilin PulG
MIGIKNRKGETLLEVLIALTLVVVTAAAASSAVISATKSLSLSKNYLVAQNLGSEALEAIKNIRDTNWMKFPINKDECWLVVEEISKAEDCATSDRLEYISTAGAVNDYVIKFENNRWTAAKQTQTMEANINAFALREIGGKYTTEITTEAPSFYRVARIKGETAGESITVQIIVKWYEGAKLYEITGTEILTNYLE